MPISGAPAGAASAVPPYVKPLLGRLAGRTSAVLGCKHLVSNQDSGASCRSTPSWGNVSYLRNYRYVDCRLDLNQCPDSSDRS